MSRVRMIGVAATLAVFVYLGVTATDTHVGSLMTIVQSALEAGPNSDFFIFEPVYVEAEILWILVIAVYGFLLVGGLPLATLALGIEYRRARRDSGRPLTVRGKPYACLTFQIVSCALSTLLVAWFTAMVLTADRYQLNAAGLSFVGYFGVQLIMGIAAIPVWRREILHTSAVCQRVLFPDWA